MLEALKRWFSGRPAPVDRDLDPQVAAAALLVEAALVDGVYANLESCMSMTFAAPRPDSALNRASLSD